MEGPLRLKGHKTRSNNLSLDMNDLSAIQKPRVNAESFNDTNQSLITELQGQIRNR